ncbi:MAG: hypothetical protein VKJ09_06360 [Leptolyngbya sp.]|nr:hypothetical protein [Leptolyngbya sp.]
MLEICPLKFALSELFAQASDRGFLTLADRYGLLANLLHESTLTEEERHAIDRILRAAARGRVKVVDDISAIVDTLEV